MHPRKLSVWTTRPGQDRMPPRLNWLLDKRRTGAALEATASTRPDEIAVVAVVQDPEAWRQAPQVAAPTTIVACGDVWIVTGRVSLSEIEPLVAQEFVREVELARPLAASLTDVVRDVRAGTAAEEAGSASGGGGVVVGVVDLGCDFKHRNFMNEDGTSRIEALWDQKGAYIPGASVRYGRLHVKAQIDAALSQPDPYRALAYGSSVGQWAEGNHGTHVLDILAGNGRGSGVPGIAPRADIVFVDLAADDIPRSGPDVVQVSLGDSVRLLEAVAWIFDRAGDRPCVVNISLGTHGGPHDGSTPFDKGLSGLTTARSGRAVVVAAGNNRGKSIHGKAVATRAAPAQFRWRVQSSNAGDVELEFWYPRVERLDARLIAPDGTGYGPVGPDEQARILDEDGETAVLVAGRLNVAGGDNMFGVFLAEGVPAGEWEIRFSTPSREASFAVHGWIERRDIGQSCFVGTCVDEDCTLGSLSCCADAIVVGSYDATKEALPIDPRSSAGPTRDARQKPDICAPGRNVTAARSTTGDGTLRMSGTSMAAPAVAGGIAVLFAEALTEGEKLPFARTRDYLVRSARPISTGDAAWDRLHGHGRLDVLGAISEWRRNRRNA